VVEFDVQSDQAFADSLAALGDAVADAVVSDLFQVAALMSWPEFCAAYQWREHVRVPIDTYPGALPYYRFVVTLPAGLDRDQVDIFAVTYEDSVVLCAVAQ
jgi:hypothetical protein